MANKVYYKIGTAAHPDGSVYLEYHLNRERQCVVGMRSLSKGVKVQDKSGGEVMDPLEIAHRVAEWHREAALYNMTPVD